MLVLILLPLLLIEEAVGVHWSCESRSSLHREECECRSRHTQGVEVCIVGKEETRSRVVVCDLPQCRRCGWRDTQGRILEAEFGTGTAREQTDHKYRDSLKLQILEVLKL